MGADIIICSGINQGICFCQINLTNVNIQRKKYLYLMINLGNKIKKLREDARLPSGPRKTSLSASFLSQRSWGGSPSIASLENIASALNVHITYFFDDPSREDSIVIRKSERKKIYSQGSKAIIQPLAYQLSKKKIEPFMLTLEVGGESGEHPYSSHHGEEFGIIINGKVRFILDVKEYTLGKGDSVYF